MGNLEFLKVFIASTFLIGTCALAEIPNLSSPVTIDLAKVKITDVVGTTPTFGKEGVAVFIEAGSRCPIMRRYSSTIESLSKSYEGKVQFYLVDSAAHDTRESASAEAKDFNLSLSVLMDNGQNFARALGFIMSTQAAVVNLKTGDIIYRGAIDDSYTFDGPRLPKHPYLKDAIDAAIAGKVPALRTARAYGCAITFK